jgi:hypothetical protein
MASKGVGASRKECLEMAHILWRKSGNDWRMSKTKPPDLAEVPNATAYR